MARLLDQISQVFRGKNIMVRKFPETPKISSQSLQGAFEHLGPGQPGKGQDREMAQGLRGVILTAGEAPGLGGFNGSGLQRQ